MPRASKGAGGFTLIELVLVVVILGVLAAVALPKYVNLGAQARQESLRAFGVAMTQATYHNRVAHAIGRPEAVPVRGPGICSKAFSESMLMTPVPANVTFVTMTGSSCATAGAPSMRCMAMLRPAGEAGLSYTYNVHCAGN